MAMPQCGIGGATPRLLSPKVPGYDAGS